MAGVFIGFALASRRSVPNVRTLWFEDVSVWHEPILPTPIGKFTFRQLAILIVFGIVAYGVAGTQPPQDLMARIMAGAIVFLPGLFLAFKRVKTVSPEAHLAMLLFGGFRGAGPKPVRRRAKGRRGVLPVEEPKPLEVPRRVEVEVGAATVEKPIVISGVLRNPRSGEPLPLRSFTVYVDGRRHQDGFTDERGSFTIYFTPQHPGLHTVELVPEGYSGEPFKIEVDVKLSGRVRIRGPGEE